jgi:hypothetical protein
VSSTYDAIIVINKQLNDALITRALWKEQFPLKGDRENEENDRVYLELTAKP